MKREANPRLYFCTIEDNKIWMIKISCVFLPALGSSSNVKVVDVSWRVKDGTAILEFDGWNLETSGTSLLDLKRAQILY